MSAGISIIIVNWNGKKWLKKLLDSVEAQTYEKYEIIFVDNKSDDGSVDYVQQNYPNVIIVQNHENAGFAGGNNLGVKHASFDLVMLLNSDTWISKDFVKVLEAEMRVRKLDVIAPREADYHTGQVRTPYVTLIDPFGHPIFLPKTPRRAKSFYLSGVCLLFSKQLYQSTGGLDDNFFMYCEEVDWFWRLKLYGYSFDYSESTIINHFGGGSSSKGLNENVFLWRNENTLKMLKKNYQTRTLFFILPIYYLMGLIESLIFVILGKTKLASSYNHAWSNVRDQKSFIKKQHAEIQSARKTPEFEIMKSMYYGIAKIHHLIFFIGNRK